MHSRFLEKEVDFYLRRIIENVDSISVFPKLLE